MVVRDGENAVSLKNITLEPFPSSTGSIDGATILQKINRPAFSEGYIPKVSNVSFSPAAVSQMNQEGDEIGSATLPVPSGILSLSVENPGATSYELLVT